MRDEKKRDSNSKAAVIRRKVFEIVGVLTVTLILGLLAYLCTAGPGDVCRLIDHLIWLLQHCQNTLADAQPVDLAVCCLLVWLKLLRRW